jgi:hypothetical protein
MEEATFCGRRSAVVWIEFSGWFGYAQRAAPTWDGVTGSAGKHWERMALEKSPLTEACFLENPVMGIQEGG